MVFTPIIKTFSKFVIAIKKNNFIMLFNLKLNRDKYKNTEYRGQIYLKTIKY